LLRKLRQYLPKGMCMRYIDQVHCSRIAAALNNRPRLRLGFKTPHFKVDFKLHSLLPGKVELLAGRCALLQVQIDEALVRNASLFRH
jgi:hypothetical protein